MKYILLIFFSLGIVCSGEICRAQTATGYTATFCDKAPGTITKAELLEICDKKLAMVQLSGGKDGCEMTHFSIAVTDINQNRTLYYEKIKGHKMTKEALEWLKQAEAGQKIILSGFEVKCGKETEFIKQEFVYNIVE